ncbi:MAG: DUF2924 domain-containing protein [Pseudomonadota bacterium]
MSDTHPEMRPPTLDDVAELDRSALLEAWRRTFSEPPPKRLSSPFLRRFIAFEIQAQRLGGLTRQVRRQLDRSSISDAPRPIPLTPGGRLLREWNGTTHRIDVVEDGFLWQGHRYRSLSAVARAITGARWSGPRFFGLKDHP